MDADLDNLYARSTIADSMERIETQLGAISAIEADMANELEAIAAGLVEATEIRYVETISRPGAAMCEHVFEGFRMIAMVDGSNVCITSLDDDELGLCEIVLNNEQANGKNTFRLDVDTGFEPIDAAAMLALVVDEAGPLLGIEAVDNMLWLMHIVLSKIAENATPKQ